MMNDRQDPTSQEVELLQNLHQILNDCDEATIMDTYRREAFQPVRDVIASAPDDPFILIRCAMLLKRHHSGYLLAKKTYERVLGIDPENSTVLKNLSSMAALQGEYENAVIYGERLISIPAAQTPENYFIAARAYRLSGNLAQSQFYLRKVIDLIDSDISTRALREGAVLKPVAARLGGWNDEADAAMRDICCVDGEGTYFRDLKLYPESIEEQLGRLRAITAGKDVCIFGAGPSLQEIADKNNILSHDQFVHFAINTFPIIEDEILNPVGAKLSLTCFTHPGVLLENNAKVEEFLRRPYPTMTLLNSFVTDYCSNRTECGYLEDYKSQIFKYRAINQLPPTPRDPLGFPSLNTFLVALCAAILGRPRRIFLFGFDQRVEGERDKKSAYFKGFKDRYRTQDDSDFPRWRYEADWVKWDGIQVNEVSIITLRMIALMFNLNLPPIYNVCPNSALEGYPKINVSQFKEMVDETSFPIIKA
jgi:tetratricopeptide (TPR) repeat protein